MGRLNAAAAATFLVVAFVMHNFFNTSFDWAILAAIVLAVAAVWPDDYLQRLTTMDNWIRKFDKKAPSK